MTDMEFICYVELHSTTPRALFSAQHVNRLFKLAGKPAPLAASENSFFTLRSEMADPLCKAARLRLEAPQ